MRETKRVSHNQRPWRDMRANCYLRPAWTHNGSIKTDLPLTVIRKKNRRLIDTISAGQLFCVGKVYLKTRDGTVRIK
ncbi:MAG: hypothetical protein ACE5NM_10265 [Sedimentisphaerales bacterium]